MAKLEIQIKSRKNRDRMIFFFIIGILNLLFLVQASTLEREIILQKLYSSRLYKVMKVHNKIQKFINEDQRLHFLVPKLQKRIDE